MMWRQALVAVCLAASLVVSRDAWAHPLEVVPADDPVYENLYRLSSIGLVPLWATSSRPLTRLDLARMLARGLDRLATDRNGFTTSDLLDLEDLVLEFSDELFLLGYRIVEPPRGPTALAVTGWGARLERAIVSRIESGSPPWYEPTSGSWLQLDINEVLGLGPSTAMGARLRPQLLPTPDASTALERLYISSAGQDVNFRLGRDFLWWGPGRRGAFLLSDNAGATDYLIASKESSRLRAMKLLVPLSLQDGRYLYGIRFDWLAAHNLRIGYGETVVGSGGVYIPYIISPIPLLAYLTRRQPEQDNFNLALDFDWNMSHGAILYGELFADDLTTYISGLTPANPFPSRTGWTLGGFLAEPLALRRTDLRIEFTQASNWVYTTVSDPNDYVKDGRSLGHWCAPDCELWSVGLIQRFDSGSTMELGYDLVKKGEGQLGQVWSGPAEAWDKLYLSGVVETTQAWRLSFKWTPTPAEHQGIGAIWSSVDNASHVAGQTRQDWFLWWEARYEF